MPKISLKKVKHQVRLAFDFYCNNQYSEAINHYKEALSYLDWVSAEIHFPYFYSTYPKILNIISDIWKRLGEIYRKIGNSKEEAISLAQEKYYSELDAVYTKIYLKFRNSGHD